MSGKPAPNWDSEGESPRVGIPLDDGLSERLGQGCTPGGQEGADRADENGPEEYEDECAWLQEEEVEEEQEDDEEGAEGDEGKELCGEQDEADDDEQEELRRQEAEEDEERRRDEEEREREEEERKRKQEEEDWDEDEHRRVWPIPDPIDPGGL
jgi:hypothetical protein